MPPNTTGVIPAALGAEYKASLEEGSEEEDLFSEAEPSARELAVVQAVVAFVGRGGAA